MSTDVLLAVAPAPARRETTLPPGAVTWLAVAVIFECLIALLTIREVVFPTTLLAVAMAVCFVRTPMEVGRPSTAGLLLTILFVIKLYLAPWQPADLRTFLAFPAAHAASQAMLVWQVVALVSRDRTWLQYLPLVGALTCICLADVEVSSVERATFLWLLLGFLTACALSFHAALRRRGERVAAWSSRTALEAMTLAVMCGVVLTAVPLVARYWRQIEQFLNDRMMPNQRDGQVGFSPISQIGQIVRLRKTGGLTTVVRIAAGKEPGHVRGAVFDTYMAGASWRSEATWAILQSREDKSPTDRAIHTEYQFDLVPGGGRDGGDVMQVWPEAKTYGRLLAPLEAQRIKLPLDRVQRDAAGVLALLPGDDGYLPYKLVLKDRFARRAVDDPQRETHEPPVPGVLRDSIRPEVLSLLDEALGDEAARRGLSTEDVLARLRRWMNSKFVYSLESTAPPETDPAIHFLKSSRAGHCELFATGTVLMLWGQGIPARYVTGLVVSERNDKGGYWVGRQRDAHAWVEVWLEGEGWITFDTTPEGGQPDQTPPPFWSREWESLQWFLQQARTALLADPRAGLELLMRAVFQTWPGFVVTFSLGTWLVTRVFWPALASWRSRPVELVDVPQRLVQRALAIAASRQLVRQPGETLERFAARLSPTDAPTTWSPVADWLRRYAGMRYAGELSESEVRELEASLRAVEALRTSSG